MSPCACYRAVRLLRVTPAGSLNKRQRRRSKAALVLEEVEFPFTHDLDALRNLLPGSWSVRDTHPDLAELTEWAVETRYPGDWPEHTDADATRAVSQARSVHDSVAAEFRRRGPLAE